MFRLGSLSLFGMIFFVGTSTADPPSDPVTKNLSVQLAMGQARDLLMKGKGQQAVEVMEAQLPNVNGNKAFLTLLRDAYGVYIKDLYIAGQREHAKRYVDRLSILDPQMAEALRAQADPPPSTTAPQPEQTPKTTIFPRWKDKREEAQNGVIVPKKGPVVRAQAEEITVDPFDPSNQRSMPAEKNKSQEYLTRGMEQFDSKRFAEARLSFELAHSADQRCLDTCRNQWAYCMMKVVSDQLERPAPNCNWSEMQQQVKTAMQMSPKLSDSGQKLLQQLDQQAKSPEGKTPPPLVSAVKVKHIGQNSDGWLVVETSHFRIFHRQNAEFGERVAQIAEHTRVNMHHKWFNSECGEWSPVCDLIVHPNAASYSQMTAVPGSSPGHSRIESDPSGRVISRRMDLRHDVNGMIDAILPHETTHVVLAGMFGSSAVPRWVDEGIAVLSEPNDKIEQHRRNLMKNHQDGQLFELRELMELKDYPSPRRIGAFYAQSVILVEYLSKQRSPQVFTDFVKDGLRNGYESALQRHYNLNFAQLQQQWTEQVLNNAGRVVARK
jgi:hypothetical protein